MSQSVTVDESQLKKLEGLLPAFYDLEDSAVLAKVLYARATENSQNVLVNTLLQSLTQSIVFDWYKLFDMQGGSQYWKQLTVEQKAYREQVYEKADFNYDSWTQFRNHMSEAHGLLLNNNVALVELARIKRSVELEKLFSVISVTHDWIIELVKDSVNAFGTRIRDYDYIDNLNGYVEQCVEGMLGVEENPL